MKQVMSLFAGPRAFVLGAALLSVAAVASLCLALAVVASLAGWAREPGVGPAYTVAQIQRGLRLQPGYWLGRSVRACGIFVATCGAPDAQGHGGGCLIAQPGEPQFGLVDSTTSDPDVDLKRSLPLRPWPVDEPLYGLLLSWLRLRIAPRHQILAAGTRVYLVTLRKEKPCEALAWARPCGYADLPL